MVSMLRCLASSCIASVRYSAVALEGSLLGLLAEHVRDRLEATYRSVREDLGDEIRQQLKPFAGYPADLEYPSMCRRSMPLTASSMTKRATSR